MGLAGAARFPEHQAARQPSQARARPAVDGATSDEQSTWQLEPFFWSNGASLTKVDSPAFESSLQLWVNMVKDGSASKSVLTWGQDPDLTQQFMHQHAAMIVDGPWIFPELNELGWKYNDQYGIVPIPTDHAEGWLRLALPGATARY